MLPSLMYTGPLGGKCTLHNLGAVPEKQASEKVQSAQLKKKKEKEKQKPAYEPKRISFCGISRGLVC